MIEMKGSKDVSSKSSVDLLYKSLFGLVVDFVRLNLCLLGNCENNNEMNFQSNARNPQTSSTSSTYIEDIKWGELLLRIEIVFGRILLKAAFLIQ